ncbi:MAG: hypothetical protein IT448_01975 [Phycisphaerales bacterium]|nr:hypothetical protein [Phycisphaerales bacterium]
MKRLTVIFCLVCLSLLSTSAAGQTTQPASDETMNWLLSEAQPLPTTQPMAPASTEPATTAPSPVDPNIEAISPFTSAPTDNSTVSLWAYITFSNDTQISGPVSTTEGKPIRLWDDSRQEYRDIPLNMIQSMQAFVLWQRDQAQWKFTDSGDDAKETTGQTYPARELIYAVTLINGQSLRGGIVAPLYLQIDGRTRTLVLNKRQKGEIGQTLDELIYLKQVLITHGNPTTQPAAKPTDPDESDQPNKSDAAIN